jgi:hypothetical protein
MSLQRHGGRSLLRRHHASWGEIDNHDVAYGHPSILVAKSHLRTSAEGLRIPPVCQNKTGSVEPTSPDTEAMLSRFAYVDRFSWAQQAFNAKIPAPVEDARILKVARRGFPHPLISLGFRRFRAIDVPDDVPFNRCCKPMV